MQQPVDILKKLLTKPLITHVLTYISNRKAKGPQDPSKTRGPSLILAGLETLQSWDDIWNKGRNFCKQHKDCAEGLTTGWTISQDDKPKNKIKDGIMTENS